MTRLFRLDATRVPSVSAISRTCWKSAFGFLVVKIEHLLDDTRDGFAVPIGNGEQTQMIPFAQQRVGRGHEAARDHRSAADRHQVDDDEHDRENGEREKDDT